MEKSFFFSGIEAATIPGMLNKIEMIDWAKILFLFRRGRQTGIPHIGVYLPLSILFFPDAYILSCV
jgi:hypothetical protein